MSLKGLFTNGEENDALKKRLAELEKSIKKINTLDVHVKRFLQWERDMGPLLKKKEKESQSSERVGERKPGSKIEAEKTVRQLVAREIQPFLAEISRLNKMIENLAVEGEKRKKAFPRKVKLARQMTAQKDGGETAELLLRLERMGLLMAEMHGVITEQARRIVELEESENKRQQSEKEEKTVLQPPPVVYQEYKIERVIIDKYELNNTIGQLGIKELGGQLNIGATYGVNRPPEIGGMDSPENSECPNNLDPSTEEESSE